MVMTITPAEQRVILHNISWETFNTILQELGENRSERLAYNEGYLEIMTPLGEHENTNRFIDDLMRILADELNLNLKKFGSLTLKRDDIRRGIEPDSCYYIQNEPVVRGKKDIDLKYDPPPDLVVEIDITNSSLNKRSIYAALGVPEIWLYDGQNLKFFVLSEQVQTYKQVKQSPTFPVLTKNVVLQLIEQSLTDGETATLRSFRAWLKQRLEH
ncbi:Uma2 family endonuclease [Halotia branconii CENA392]|uniref:Uma2 family endonuclease n=2 Tax=Halotia TaxID=1620790 RepID=A0AAJ6NQY1_9CYAN|nr:Uma2 family endonuclease [Halotia branconii]WGV24952.1 Uma2 family endonuclease [Halotia branconii CENA392]